MGTLARICRYILRSWPLFLVSVVCVLVGTIVSVQIPLLTRAAIDEVITPLAEGLDVELGKGMLFGL
ncbi:hypothetical protein KAU55_05580, partial [Candidatus Bathyarchaeota archaeon]|nr:hypothetical protein [Candidatus Bathyarchaeota archaeon]